MTDAITIRRVLALAGTLAFTVTLFQVNARARVPDTPCKEKCLADYEAAAEKCTEIKNNEEARKTCNDTAHTRYKSCRESCEKTDKADCKERCKKQCDKIHDRCHADCTKNDPTQACHSQCNNEYAECLRECDKDC